MPLYLPHTLSSQSRRMGSVVTREEFSVNRKMGSWLHFHDRPTAGERDSSVLVQGRYNVSKRGDYGTGSYTYKCLIMLMHLPINFYREQIIHMYFTSHPVSYTKDDMFEA